VTIQKKIIICVVSWVIAGTISLLVLLDGALSHSETKKNSANKIIISLVAVNVGLNIFILLRKSKRNRS